MNLLVVAAGACFVAIAAGLIRGSSSPVRTRSSESDPPQGDAYELAQADPVEALSRFGTPENHEELLEQGVDLRGLGYEPPSER